MAIPKVKRLQVWKPGNDVGKPFVCYLAPRKAKRLQVFMGGKVGKPLVCYLAPRKVEAFAGFYGRQGGQAPRLLSYRNAKGQAFAGF